jgi:alkanesulfonate monooxygenase SsuD/methylene tetrahydromethanopterin reductase-like flavin-dependent oxidoreductase (luciferase family)
MADSAERIVERYEGLEVTTDNLRRLLGEDAARALSAHFGGSRVYVPKSPGEHHPISVAIGQDAAAQLAGAFHGNTITIPIAPEKQAEIHRLGAEGKTRREIAAEVRCTERWVYKTLETAKKSKPPPRGLFD